MGEKRREGRMCHASEINWECCNFIVWSLGRVAGYDQTEDNASSRACHDEM